MGYIPKEKVEIFPVLKAGNNLIGDNSQLQNQFLSRFGDTSLYDYYLGNLTLDDGLSGGTLSSNTVASNFYFSAGTPLELIIQNISSQYASSGGTGENFFESGFTGSMAIQLKNGFNITSGDTSFTLGSYNTGLTPSTSILGGKFNSSIGQLYSYSKYSVIGNGKYNQNNAAYSIIGTGLQNSIGAYSKYSSIITGRLNNIQTNCSSIVAGKNNTINNLADYGLIGSGKYNLASRRYSVIVNGNRNTNNSRYGFVGNGHYNILYNAGIGYSSILNGNFNKMSGATSAIVTGRYNFVYSNYSTILGGRDNIISGSYSSILNGRYCLIDSQANHSMIMNGVHNSINGVGVNNAIVNGQRNTIAPGVFNSSILGGEYITALSSNTVYAPFIVSIPLTSNTTNTVYVQPDGLLVIGQPTSAITVGSSTYVQNGINTFTGGTATLVSVNITAATLTNLTVTGQTSLKTVSATTIYSNNVDIASLYASASSVGVLQSQISTKVNRSGDTMTGLLNAPSISATTLSATTYYSGSTPLNSYFSNLSNQLNTKVNRSGDTMTGLLTTPSLSSSTISGGTYYSGSTPLSTYFGESNTGSNLSSFGIFNSKVGTDLQFRGLSGGTGIAITQQTSAVTITYTGVSSSGAVTTINNGINTFTAGTSIFQSVNITGASLTTLTVSGTSSFAIASATTLSAQTIFYPRIVIRTGTTVSSATPTINTDLYDIFYITALVVDITSFTTNLTGTAYDGQKLHIAITGTATRNLTWGALFESSSVTLPSATSGTNRLDVGLMWNTVSGKWRCLAIC